MNKDEDNKEQNCFSDILNNPNEDKNSNNANKDIQIKQKYYAEKELQRNKIMKQNNEITEELEHNNFMANSNITQFFQQVKIGTIDYFKSYFNYFTCYKSEKSDLLQFCIKKIYNYTDICFFVNKLIELEKLKHLILDSDQVSLFECIPKPRVGNSLVQQQDDYAFPSLKKLEKYDQKMNQNKRRSSIVNILSLQNRTLQERIRQAQISFKKIQNKTHKKNNIDEKLIQMLDINLIKTLDQSINDTTIDRLAQLLNQNKLHKNHQSSFFNTQQNFKGNKEIEDDSPQLQISNICLDKKNSVIMHSERSKNLSQYSIIDLKDDLNQAQAQKIYSQKDVNIIPHHLATVVDLKLNEEQMSKSQIIPNQEDVSQVSYIGETKIFDNQIKTQSNMLNQNE